MKRAAWAHDADASKESRKSMNPAQKALWYVESHLAEPLTLDEIAAVGGVSRFHLVRAFAEATGMSVMRYVRARRLTKAARALAPGRARYSDAGAGGGLRLPRSVHPRVPRPFRRHAEAGSRRNVPRHAQASGADHDGFNPARQSASRRVSKPPRPFLVAGVGERYNHENCGAGIPNQWQQFHQKVDDIPARIGKVAYGVCCNGDDSGNFDYVAGVEVSDFSDLPREFARVRIPEQRYAVFTHTEHISTIRRTVDAIWNQWLPAVRPEGRRRAELRALRREIRSGHRQWRAGDLGAGEGVGCGWVGGERRPAASARLRLSWQCLLTIYARQLSSSACGAGDERLGSVARRLPNILYTLVLFRSARPEKSAWKPMRCAARRTGPEFALQHKSIRTDRRFRAPCQKLSSKLNRPQVSLKFRDWRVP